jgi:hypothetical protein
MHGQSRAAKGAALSEHAVLIEFKYGPADLSTLFALEEELERAIPPGVGELDGNEMAVDLSDGTLYLYGPDADALWHAIEPVVIAASFIQGAIVRLRYGPPADGVREVVHKLP